MLIINELEFDYLTLELALEVALKRWKALSRLGV